METYFCYLLAGEYADGEPLEYYGVVRKLRGQTKEEACTWRLGQHKECLKFCLRGAKLDSLSCVPRSVLMPEKQAVLEEVALTARAFPRNHRARGGPYCRKDLPGRDVKELKELEGLATGDIGKLAAKKSLSSNLRLHVEMRCFACKKLRWKVCDCRSPCRPSPLAASASSSASHTSVSAASSSSVASRPALPARSFKPVLPIQKASKAMKTMKAKAMKAPLAMKGKKSAMKRDRSHRDRRGERSKSGSQKLKDWGIGPGHPEYKRLHWGKNFKRNWRQANRNLYHKKKGCAAK